MEQLKKSFMRRVAGDSEPHLNPIKETQFFLKNVHCGTQLQSCALFLSDELPHPAVKITKQMGPN